MAEFRVHNGRIDVIIEAESNEEATEKFVQRFPNEARHTIIVNQVKEEDKE